MSNILNRFVHLQQQGLVEEIDVELCRFLQEQEPDVPDEVLTAAGLVSALYRQGDVCLPLKQYAGQPLFADEDPKSDKMIAPDLEVWQKALRASSLVGRPGTYRPLILDEQNRLYLHKLWHHEKALAEALLNRCKASSGEIDLPRLKEGLHRLFNSDTKETDWQQVAAALAVRQQLSVISGGPGTGKTSTVVRILALLVEQGEARGQMPSIALTAPTGKAAARLQEAIRTAREVLPVGESVREAIPDEAVTLHQLLGARRHTSRFRHHADNPLPFDIIIVDEVSMVDQTLMSRMMQALLRGTQLILLGDKDQLASVEAGSVLGDICLHAENIFTPKAADWLQAVEVLLPGDSMSADSCPLQDHVILLTKSYRFDEQSGVGHLARAVNAGEVGKSMQIIDDKKFSDITWINNEGGPAFRKVLKEKSRQYFQQLLRCQSAGQAFEILHDFRILAAHRKGPWGIQYINRLVEYLLQEQGLISKYDQWYPGKPVIVNVNDYALGLYNGDTGICLPDENGAPRIYFQQDDAFRSVAPSRLPDHNRAYALTVHKSQGSEFNHILLVLPDKPSPVVSRELIYTAITRARQTVSIWSSEGVLKKGLSRKLQRSSGLADRLWRD